jgi:hypothetical protein
MQWEVKKFHNGTYSLRNQQFRNHASYNLTDIGDQPSVVSIRTGTPKQWRINYSDGFYWCELLIPLTFTYSFP